mmetsp:Transcript_5755/g.13759  ORF Transcript_5755/g.13759 Transcript_5755/m.13759 type:complete len:193 (-) Transcript_5755:137-715(-)
MLSEGTAEVDLDSIKYSDKSKEKRRLEQLAERQTRREEAAAAAALMPQHDKVAERNARRVKRKGERNAKAQAKHLATRALAADGAKAKADKEDMDEEEDDFASEARLLKRFKKGKVSAKDLDKAMGVQNSDEEKEEKEDERSDEDEDSEGPGAAVPVLTAVDPEQARRSEIQRQKRKRLAALRNAQPVTKRR